MSVRREYPDAPIVGVGGVVLDGSRVLLVRRGHAPLQGAWSLPGGALELGESLHQGVCRELLEETGLIVEPVALVELFDRVYHEQGSEDGPVQYHYVLADYLCRVSGGSLCCATDATDAIWAERTELARYHLEDFTLAVIEKAFRMVGEPEH